MKKIIFIICLFLTITAFGQSNNGEIAKKDSMIRARDSCFYHPRKCPPLYVIDNVKIKSDDIEKFNPKEMATLEVLKDYTAFEKYGDEGKNGVVLITTKNYARKKYWDFFKSKSADYVKAVPTIKDEENVIYILNDKVLEKDFEGDLYKINDSNFIELKVLDKKQLKKDFNIADKKWGIIIKTVSKK